MSANPSRLRVCWVAESLHLEQEGAQAQKGFQRRGVGGNGGKCTFDEGKKVRK